MVFTKGNKIWVGRKHSPESIQKISKNHSDVSGKNNPMYGKHHSEETKDKIRDSKDIEKYILMNLGENNPYWKGDKVKYRGLHRWINAHLPKPQLCEICNIKPPRDAANITGIYNRDFNNWKYLCRSCHRILDNKK